MKVYIVIDTINYKPLVIVDAVYDSKELVEKHIKDETIECAGTHIKPSKMIGCEVRTKLEYKTKIE